MIDPFHVQSKKAENKKKGWKFKEKEKSCVQHFEPFMSTTTGDGGILARGTEPDSELLTHCLGPIAPCTLLPRTLLFML